MNGQTFGNQPNEFGDSQKMPPDEILDPKPRRWIAGLATILFILILIILAVVTWVGLQSDWVSVPEAWFTVLFLGFPIVGWFIAVKLPRNPLGWIYLAFIFVLAIGFWIEQVALTRAQAGSDANVAVLLIVGGWITFTGYWLLLSPGILLFPDGRVLSNRFRWVLWSLAAVMMVWVVVYAVGNEFICLAPLDQLGEPCVQFIKNPLANSMAAGLDEVADALLQLWFYLAVGTSLIAVYIRYRRSTGVVRQQIKWVAWMAVAALIMLIAEYLVQDILGLISSDWGDMVSFVPIVVGFPVAIAIAIFKYRLYDIDRLISRTLSYGILTGTLLAIYFGSVAVLQRLLPTEAPFAIVISTLIIAALFNPLRLRFQGVIDSRFYRRKYDAEKILSSFAVKVRDEVNLDALSFEILRTVREAMQPENASLWMRGDKIN